MPFSSGKSCGSSVGQTKKLRRREMITPNSSPRIAALLELAKRRARADVCVFSDLRRLLTLDLPYNPPAGHSCACHGADDVPVTQKITARRTGEKFRSPSRGSDRPAGYRFRGRAERWPDATSDAGPLRLVLARERLRDRLLVALLGRRLHLYPTGDSQSWGGE
jgi:hypothetical protein